MNKNDFQLLQEKTEGLIKAAEQGVLELRALSDSVSFFQHSARLKAAQGYLAEARAEIVFCDGYYYKK